MGEYTKYGYDNEGRQVRSVQYVRNASNTFVLYAETVFEYANGLLVRETVSYPAQVAVTIYKYAEGRLVKKSFLDGKNTPLHDPVYAYEGEGKLMGETNLIDLGITTSFVRYTYRNCLRQERQMLSGDRARSNPPLWSTIRYAYDAQNRPVSEKKEYISPLSSAGFPTGKYEYY